jgi:hypothetical protein
VGAIAPTISPPCNPDHPAQRFFRKSSGKEPLIPENDQSLNGTFWKKSGHFAEHLKKSGKVHED